MPYIDELAESFNHADDSGVSVGLLMSDMSNFLEREDGLALHIIKDADNNTETPFLSRTVAWAFCVDWLSTENPDSWIERMKHTASTENNGALARIVDEISQPLLKVLVARNKLMVTANDNTGHPDYRLSSSMYKVLNIPRSLADVKKVMDKEPRDAKYWFTTHLLTLLQDRLIWAISQRARDDTPHIPLRALEDDASVYRMQHPPLALGDMKLDKKMAQWVGYGDCRWLETVKKFIFAWEEYRETVRIPSVGPAEENTLRRLFRSTTQIQAKGILMPILCNIQEAALALASFKLVSDGLCTLVDSC